MNNEENLIRFGEDAEALLKSEHFVRTVNRLVEGTFQAFINSKPEETKERNITYYHYRALVDLVNTLKQEVSVKDEIISKNGDNSQEEA